MDVFWGQLTQAFRDTTIAYSEREALIRNGQMHGFERPGLEISEAAYGDALNQCAYGRRGTNLSMFDTIEGALSDYNVRVDGAHIHPAYPNQIIDPAGTNFSDDWNNRYVRIGDYVYYVQYVELGVPRTTDAVYPTANVLRVAPVDGTYTSRLTIDQFEIVRVILLPFVIRVTQPAVLNFASNTWNGEEICLYEVLFFGLQGSAVPPSYLIEADLSLFSDPPTPAGMPYGSQLVDENTIGHQIDPITLTDDGPHPVYLNDDSIFPGLTEQLNRLMCAGYILRIIHAIL